MSTETFLVKTKPKTAAMKAQTAMKQARLKGFSLKAWGVTQSGDAFIANARWEEQGLFGDVAELRVEAQPSYNGTEVVIDFSNRRCENLAERLRRSL